MPFWATFSLFALLFSIATKDERRTMFSLETFADRTFLFATGASILTLILATVFQPLRAFLNTTTIDGGLWAICFVIACSVVVASEIRKFVLRRHAPAHAPALPTAPTAGDGTRTDAVHPAGAQV